MAKKLFCESCGGKMTIITEDVHISGAGSNPVIKLRCDKCDITRLEELQDVQKELGEEDRANAKPGRTLSILSIVFAVCSLLGLPIVFGPVGVIFGVLAVSKGDKELGYLGIVLSIGLAIISTLVAVIVLKGAGI